MFKRTKDLLSTVVDELQGGFHLPVWEKTNKKGNNGLPYGFYFI
uniref:Uncharacterized protein n=1 Tax=Arundo donax TaxID=35708 RepID=A0A0A9CDJ9_ARUDO